MKGNEKIGITAEFAALIKSEKDSRYGVFVSNKTRNIYRFFNFILPGTVRRVFEKRQALCSGIESLVLSEKPKTVVNLGAGLSLFGLRLGEDTNYFEVDFQSVLDYKKQKLEDRGIPYSARFLGSDLLDGFKIPLNGKSVFFAEGVASYFDSDEFDSFVGNLYNAMGRNSVFYYHEKWADESSSYNFLRGFVSLMSRSKSHSHFDSREDARSYFSEKGFRKIDFKKKGSLDFIRLEK